jgi:hypothetical protein
MRALGAAVTLLVMALVGPARAGNPLFDGWYADPEGTIIGDEYWIFPTYSAPYDRQLHFDAFSSKDLVTWTKHERIISNREISWLLPLSRASLRLRTSDGLFRGQAYFGVRPRVKPRVKPHMDFNAVKQRFEAALKKAEIKLRAPDLKALYAAFTAKDEAAEPVVKKKTKEAVEYEPDTDLRDTEQVPLLEEGGIEAFFRREVLPHVPDAWIDHSKTQIGYEISFTRHFYKPTPLRSLDEIKADLVALQEESKGLLEQIIGGDKK